MGLESSVTVKFHSGVAERAGEGGMNTQPESKPPATGSQGAAKVDCVTVWFPGAPMNLKVITVPLGAVMVLGMNWKTPPAAVAVEPTCTDI